MLTPQITTPTSITDLTPYWKTDGSSGPAIGNWDLGGVTITDSSFVPAISVDNRYLKNTSGDTTIDWGNKGLISSGLTTLDWSNGQLTDTSGVASFNWNSRQINNSLNRVVYDGEYNFIYAFNVTNHVVADFATQRLYDIADQASIHWTNRELYANDGGTVLANYANVTGMRFKPKIFVGSNITTAPVSAIHVDSGSTIASELRFTAGVTTGQTTADGFQVGITSSGIAEIRQRENLELNVYTNNVLAMAISSTGNVGIGTSPASARLHAVSITEQFRLGYNVSNYMNVILNSTGSPTFALVGTAPEFYFSNPVNVPYEIYGAGWNGNLEVPTKDAVYDKIESLNPIFGTYTPTLTNTTNVSASTARLCTYMRVGNTVTVAGQFDIDCIAPATATVLRITLPVASNFSTAYQLGGTAFATAVAGMGAGIEADATNDVALVKFNSSDINNQTMSFTFSYQVI